MTDGDEDAPRVVGNVDDLGILRRPFIWVTIVVFAICVAGVVAIYGLFAHNVWSVGIDRGKLAGFLVLARLTHVTVGIIMGGAVTLIGVLLAWIGVISRSDDRTGGYLHSEKLVTLAPGVLLIVCGSILLGVCMTGAVTDITDGKDVIEIKAGD